MFYKIQQVADMLGLEKETVRRYIRSGKLKAYKINKHYLIKKEDYNAYVNGNFCKSIGVSENELKMY